MKKPSKSAAQKRCYAKKSYFYRDQQFKRLYGITLADKDAMIAAQGGGCFICKRQFDPSVPMSVACLDHNHQTGSPRKVLCKACNTALGMIKENFDTAISLAKYIQEDQGLV